MEWFFEKRGKSVASNAQRIVSDMHKHLDAQTKKAKEMEEIMLKFKELNIISLEKEITRLSKRKSDLATEMIETDEALTIATNALSSLQERMELVLKLPVPELTTGLNPKAVTTSSTTATALPATSTSIPASNLKQSTPSSPRPTPQPITSPSRSSSITAMHSTLKQCHPTHLFYIHQNKIESIIIFIATLQQTHPINGLYLTNATDKEGRELTPSEDSMYGVRIVPNHQRDFPHVTEMPCPPFLLTTSTTTTANSKANSNQQNMGTLIGAFEIALTSAVVVDAWQTSDGIIWATTTVDGHSFAVLERMYVVSEMSWGLQTIVQVDLYGRDESSGRVIVEHVSANDDQDDE